MTRPSKTRKKIKSAGMIALISVGLQGCDSVEESAGDVNRESAEIAATAPEISFKPSGDAEMAAAVKPGAPYKISYRIIGTPIVGSPVIVELTIESLRQPSPVRLDYRMNEASAMLLGDSQPASVVMDLAANESTFRQQVTVVPQREGRFYLNVSASTQIEDGTMSTITAIPIQVGRGTRELEAHGTLQTDENDEAVRVLESGD